MQRHPDPRFRRAVRVLAMVGELHKRGYQNLRVMPFLSPSGGYWRCYIGPVILFYRNHGAILFETKMAAQCDGDAQATAMVARYSTGDGNRYFGWSDAEQTTARLLADKFLERFRTLAVCGQGEDFAYAGWHQRMLGLAEGGWLPVVFSDYNPVSFDHLPLDDMRPDEWRSSGEDVPVLSLPPSGRFQKDYSA
jgi:hypothetical protein